jgi:hypothetical protein
MYRTLNLMKIHIRTISYATKVKVAALMLLILPTFCANLEYFRAYCRLDLQNVGKDDITVYVERFEKLRKSLPNRGTIGYIDDESDNAKASKAYILTQYALIPIIVIRGADPELVVGNFSHSSLETRESVPKNLIPIKDFGDGVILFGKRVK